jgi:hypothetical protein
MDNKSEGKENGGDHTIASKCLRLEGTFNILLHSNRISDLWTVEELHLRNINDIFPEELFEHLKNLKMLKIQSFTWKSISPKIGSLTNLRHLHSYNCPNLESLPFEIGNLTQLLTLDLDMCFRLRIVDCLTAIRGPQQSLQSIRITHNASLMSRHPQPFQQTAHLAQVCHFVSQCTNLKVLDLKGNEIGNLDGFQALTNPHLQTTSQLRLINFTENPIIYHSLQEDDIQVLTKLLTIHPGLGSFGGQVDNIDKVVDAIILRHWSSNPSTNHLQEINRAGRSLVLNHNRSFIPLGLWPIVFSRANHIFSKFRARKRTASSIFYLLRNNQELIRGLERIMRK